MGREDRQTMAQEEGTHRTMATAQNQTQGAQRQMVLVIFRDDIK
jgi:hypothetical protein